MDGNVQMVTGVNLDLAVIIANTLSVYLDVELSGGPEVRTEQSGYLAAQASLGFKYHY